MLGDLVHAIKSINEFDMLVSDAVVSTGTLVMWSKA